jgi:hypothetical protein
LNSPKRESKIQTDLGLPMFRSFCHWGCSLAHFSLGNLEEALRNQKKAETMYQETGMDYWLDKTRTLLEKL